MGWRAMGQCNNTFTAAATATTSIMHQRCHQQCQRSHQHHAPTPPPSSPPPSPSPPPPSVHIRFVLKSFRPGLNLRNVNNSVGSKLEDFFFVCPWILFAALPAVASRYNQARLRRAKGWIAFTNGIFDSWEPPIWVPVPARPQDSPAPAVVETFSTTASASEM